MYRPKYFSWEETKCKCKDDCGMNITEELMETLDKARHLAQVPFVITSGARDIEYNKAIGASKTSSHTLGLAADIKAVNSRDRLLILRSLIEAGFNRIGISKTFIHCDIADDKIDEVIWLY